MVVDPQTMRAFYRHAIPISIEKTLLYARQREFELR
jgi:hypothetical protein